MNKLFVKNAVFTLLLLAAAIALAQLAARYPLRWDLTQNAANSLEPGSVEVLKQMPGAIRITVYAAGQDARLGDMHRLIRDFIALYQRYKPGIVLTFVDPAKQPEEARKANIRAQGEMLVEYGGRTERLTTVSEQVLTGALMRLARRSDPLLLYLDGHGERSLEGAANHDLGEFGKRLQQQGFRLSPLNLALAQNVPANAAMLVIAQPQLALLPGETDKLLRHVADGGNVLWLVDAEPLRGLEPLAEKLGLLLTPGIVIDPAAEEMRTPRDWALGAGYPPHPVTRNFNLITVFPSARAIGWEEGKEWQHARLVDVAPRGWVSSRSTQGKPQFDKNRDVPGPVTVALALQREVHGREQRIVVVGSGSFLANAYSGNGGNMDLGVNMVNWLCNEDRLITIPPRAVKDGAISLGKTGLALVSGGFLIALPAALLLAGGWMWRRRRR
jgi:ABC-type uncharacterized transport system involved in gliding motility auxiliary subunit